MNFAPTEEQALIQESARRFATTELAPIRLPDVRMELRVSLHEEHVEIDVIGERRTVALSSRAHLYPLVLLARARIEDHEAGVAEPEAGWVDRASLCQMLRTERGHLNMLFYRCRQQLAQAGVVNPGALLQRRARASEVRLGVREVTVTSLGSA